MPSTTVIASRNRSATSACRPAMETSAAADGRAVVAGCRCRARQWCCVVVMGFSRFRG